MLESLQIKNLGCFNDKDYTIPFDRLTMIMGPNNSGKSMAFTGLNILKTYCFYGSFNWNNEYYNLQNYENIVNNHEVKKIEINATLNGNELRLEYHPKRIALSRNGKSINRDVLVDELLKLWHISPNRRLIPYQEPVGSTGTPFQALFPDGRNVIPFLLQKFTEREPNWGLVEEWLRRIVPEITEFKTILRGNRSYSEVIIGNIPINMNVQGSGIQSVLTVISSMLLSPEGSTIIIEEPEVFLHKRSQEMIINLFNYIIRETDKQIIFSTHSWDMLLVIMKDLVTDKRRDGGIPTNGDLFKLVTFEKTGDVITIEECELKRRYTEIQAELHEIMG